MFKQRPSKQAVSPLSEDLHRQELLKRAQSPYIIRREYNGCTVYRRISQDYIPFDLDALKIFLACRDISSEDLISYILRNTNISEVSCRQFILQCQDLGLITKDFKLNAHILDNSFIIGSSRSAPNKVHMQLTRYCSLSCPHCWASAGEARKNELSFHEIDAILKQLSDMGSYIISFGGGEYFKRSDFFEIIKKAKSYGFCINLSTNAVAVKKNIAEQLAEFNIDSFRISLDAGTEKICASVHGDSSVYRKANRGIKHLKSMCPNAKIQFYSVINKNNSSDIPAIIKRTEDFGINELVFDIAMPVGRSSSQITLSAEEAKKCINIIKNSIDNSLIKIKILPNFPPRPKRRAFEGFGCECGNTSCYISSDGSVYPNALLSGLPQFQPAGNLRRSTLFEIWNNGLKKWRSCGANSTCKNCAYYKSCRGGCRTRTLILTNSMKMPDPYCFVKQ